MPQDKYTAVWVSHTSISDFLACPRAYYLKNIYRDKKTGHKVKLMTPPFALGQIVHEVIEALSVIPTQQRFVDSLILTFDEAWKKVSGKKGGFPSTESEMKYKKRGEEMLRRVMKNPGPLARKAVKIKEKLPYFWLSDEANIILCGKIDWLEYLEETDSVHIIDFKTSQYEEKEDSLQLPIYHLLVHNCQKRKVDKASYWYLEKSDQLTPMKLPDLDESHEKILAIAKQIKTARQLERFPCPHGDKGCYACQPMEAILQEKAEFVGVDDFNSDIYIRPPRVPEDDEEDSVVL
jgi:CRISPR/Cas system-associated exonuclease Cas4 (RecB family)